MIKLYSAGNVLNVDCIIRTCTFESTNIINKALSCRKNKLRISINGVFVCHILNKFGNGVVYYIALTKTAH